MMMADLHLESAIPSLLSLVLLQFLPWAARQSLTFWRAVQVYDRQRVDSTPLTVQKPKWYKFVGLFYLVGIITLEVAFFSSSGEEWRSKMPLLAELRDNVPDLILALIVLGASKILFLHFFAPFTTASRTWSSHNKPVGILNISKRYTDDAIPANTNTLRSWITSLASFISIMVAITLSKSVSSQSPMYIAAVSGSILLVLFGQYSQFGSRRLSFRGLILWPVLVIGFTIGLLTFISAVVFVITYFKIGQKSVTVSSSSVVSNTVGVTSTGSQTAGVSNNSSPDDDLAVVQTLAIVYAYIWAFMLAAPYTMVCFAYRFDASQAGYATVDEKEASAIIEERISTQAKDKDGRVSIPLSAVALPRSALSSADLPTFKAALRTLVGVQAIGAVVDAYTSWQEQAIYPTSASQLPINNISVNVWPFLAYPLVSLAMIFSVRRQSPGAFKSLWTYGEQWIVVKEPIPTVVEETSKLEEAEKSDLLI